MAMASCRSRKLQQTININYWHMRNKLHTQGKKNSAALAQTRDRDNKGTSVVFLSLTEVQA